VLPERTGVGVGLVTAFDFTAIRLVTRVDVHVFLAVRAVGETSVTSLKFTFKWLLT
jgi:hypothetical protein